MSDEHSHEEAFEVVFDHLHARGRGDVEAVAARLHPDVVQSGVDRDLVCRGRDTVLERIGTNMARSHGGIDRLELLERNGAVIAGFGGPRFAANALLPDASVYIVFRIRDGLIIRMDHYRTRQEALQATDSSEQAG